MLMSLLAWPLPAAAQRFPFERSVSTPAPVTVEVSTLGGKITVTNGADGRVEVRGSVTVRVAWDVPPNAVELAKRLADRPPIERSGDIIRLRPPSDPVQRRAATIAYEVVVPASTRVVADTDSGAVAISGLAAPVSVLTHTSTIALSALRSDADVRTGSGAVSVDDVSGALTVTTASSAIAVQRAASIVRIRTQSGAAAADVAPSADVEVESGSGSITITGGAKALRAASGSGRIRVTGQPLGSWTLSSRSGAVEIGLHRDSRARFDLSTRSGAIVVPDTFVARTQTKRRLEGAIGDGGATVVVTTGSGSVRISAER